MFRIPVSFVQRTVWTEQARHEEALFVSIVKSTIKLPPLYQISSHSVRSAAFTSLNCLFHFIVVFRFVFLLFNMYMETLVVWLMGIFTFWYLLNCYILKLTVPSPLLRLQPLRTLGSLVSPTAFLLEQKFCHFVIQLLLVIIYNYHMFPFTFILLSFHR